MNINRRIYTYFIAPVYDTIRLTQPTYLTGKLHICGNFDEPIDMDCTEEELIFTGNGTDDLFFGVYNVPNLVSGILEANEKNVFSIYPNPVSDILNIQTMNIAFQSNVYYAKIYSPTGMQFSQMPFSNVMDISALPQGVWFLEVNGVTQKFIKQ